MARFCETCGTSLSANAGFCSACGNKSEIGTAQSSGSTGAAVKMAPVREEKVMLEDRGITVTSARFIAGGQTYAMNGVTSVKSSVYHPSKLWPVLLTIFGLFGILSGLGNQTVMGVIVGVALALLGILWFRSKKPVYAVRLTSSSGEAEAYTSEDGDFVGRVVNAINDAIVHRG